ncbi:MAG: hypothetical protein CM1200mP18_18510 [Gammaproteobacteria bacterium]|nr:MAG: hypothetical protein CM1200mP18_18510 [Gammaproteobacteria bacterium]
MELYCVCPQLLSVPPRSASNRPDRRLREQISVLCCHGGLTGYRKFLFPAVPSGRIMPHRTIHRAGHNYDTDLLAVH